MKSAMPQPNIIEEMNTEEWRPVVGCEGYCEVSSRGRARSLDHNSPADGRRVAGRMLKPRSLPTGYLRVGVTGRSDAYIHRLVLEAFVGPCPEGMEACHNDGDRQNNHVSNLRWDTKLGNCQDTVAMGTHANLQKTTCPQGHEYDTLWNGWYSKATGQRKKRACLTCKRDRERARRATA